MNRDELVTKKPILADPPLVNRDEPKKGPLVDVNLSKIDTAQQFEQPRKRQPMEVEADIKPLKRYAQKTIVACLRGGPFDGVEVDVDSMAMVHHAVIETPPEELTEFAFDPEAHRRWVETGGKEGRPNVIKGANDTITYKRTSDKTDDGCVVFQAVA